MNHQTYVHDTNTHFNHHRILRCDPIAEASRNVFCSEDGKRLSLGRTSACPLQLSEQLDDESLPWIGLYAFSRPETAHAFLKGAQRMVANTEDDEGFCTSISAVNGGHVVMIADWTGSGGVQETVDYRPSL